MASPLLTNKDELLCRSTPIRWKTANLASTVLYAGALPWALRTRISGNAFANLYFKNSVDW